MLKQMMIALSALTLTAPAYINDAAAERAPRVLYMEVDEGRDLLDKDSHAFERVFDQTGNYLHHEGIRLFEEDANYDGRSYKDAMDTAADIKRKRLDAVVTVSLRHTVEDKGNKSKDRLIAIARVHDARSLKTVETIRVKSPTAVIRDGRCDRECRDIIMRRHVREVLPEFKEKLADYLHDFKPRKKAKSTAKKIPNKYGPEKFTLTLKGFKPREVRHIEDHIAHLESTRDFSSLRSSAHKPAFWLERKRAAGNVRDDLSNVLANLDLQARIIQTQTKITLIKIHPDVAYLD